MKVFDKYAQRYDNWYEKPFGKSVFSLELKCLSEILPKNHSKESIEVGVGTGRFASALGIDLGLDTSSEELKIAKKRGIEVILGDAHNIPLRNNSLDIVLVVVSICFFEEPIKVLKEIKRVLKEEGALILGLIFLESPWAKFYMRKAQEGHPLYSYAKFYSYKEISTMLKNNNFSTEGVLSTLFEKPQDVAPIANKEVKEGFYVSGGFFCIKARKTSIT
ncbi:MAG: class I SAM-dependent methyltransferase [Thaumarchaeota archaeon]|nr:class I SAM-dependent methyltransferase [Nitrososphaerota archaeon]